MVGKQQKIASTLEQSDGGTIHMFHLYNLPRETEWQCTFNKWIMDGAIGVKINSPHIKCMGRRQKLS